MHSSISHIEFEKRAMPIEAILLAHQLVLFPLYFFIPLWIAVLNTLVAASVFYCARNPHVVINRWLKVGVTIVAIAGVYLAFRKFSGRDAGVSLIAVMYGLKILEIQTKRDANLVLSLSFFLLVAGFFFTQEPLIAFYQFIPIIALLNAFVAMQSLEKFELAAGNLKGVLKDLSRYLVIAIPIMIVLFVFFPRLGGPLWRMPGASVATTGVSDSMSLSEITELQTSENIAFRVTFDGDVPNETDMYWRVLVLDQFDGLSWRRTNRNLLPDMDEAVFEDSFDYSITLEPTKTNYLVALDKPISSPQNASLVDDQTVRSRFRLLDRTRYQLSSKPSLVIDSNLTPLQRSLNVRIPSSGNADSVDWARDLRARVGSDEEFVNEVLRTINREEYYYTLIPGEMDEQIIDSFWLDKRRGFCEHYASSLVFLARAVGIPARIVIGYQGAEKNPRTDYWIVRDANAHAWTEIWFEGSGWVRVDPTAAIASQRIEESLLQEYGQRLSLFEDFDIVELDQIGLFKELQYWMDEINSSWNDWILDYNRSRQRQFFQNWGISGLSDHMLIIIMLSIVGGLVLVSSLKWFHGRIERDPLAQKFQDFIQRFEQQGILEIAPNSGPKAIIDKLNAIDEARFSEHTQVINQYITLRYAERAPSQEQINALEKALTKLKVKS